MGSSGGGNYAPPNTPTPPANMVASQGSAAPFNPQFTSFLPGDGSMATGLTPEMLASINQPQPPMPTPGGAGSTAGLPPGLLSPAGGGYKPNLAQGFMMSMGADPKLLLGKNYDSWASTPVTRADLAAQMSRGSSGGGRRSFNIHRGGSDRGR